MDEIPFDVDGRLSAAYRRMVAEMREEAEMEIGDGDDDAEEALAGNVDGGEGERGRMAQLGEVMEAQHLVCGKVNGKPIALSPEDIEEMYQDYKKRRGHGGGVVPVIETEEEKETMREARKLARTRAGTKKAEGGDSCGSCRFGVQAHQRPVQANSSRLLVRCICATGD